MTSVMTRPRARLMRAVAIFVLSETERVSGRTTAISVISTMIHWKNVPGAGTARHSRCISAVATIAASAPRAYSAVVALPQMPSPFGASTTAWKMPRAISSPANAASAATTAVATPPAHNRPASTPYRVSRGGSTFPPYPAVKVTTSLQPTAPPASAIRRSAMSYRPPPTQRNLSHTTSRALRESGRRGAAEFAEFGQALFGALAVEQDQGARTLKLGPDVLPARHGPFECGPVAGQPSLRAGQAGRRPLVLLAGRLCGFQHAPGVGLAGHDGNLGGDRPGVGAKRVPVSQVVPAPRLGAVVTDRGHGGADVASVQADASLCEGYGRLEAVGHLAHLVPGEFVRPGEPQTAAFLIAEQAMGQDDAIDGGSHDVAGWAPGPLPGSPHVRGRGERLIEPALQYQREDQLAGAHVRQPVGYLVLLSLLGGFDGSPEITRGHGYRGNHVVGVDDLRSRPGVVPSQLAEQFAALPDEPVRFDDPALLVQRVDDSVQRAADQYRVVGRPRRGKGLAGQDGMRDSPVRELGPGLGGRDVGRGDRVTGRADVLRLREQLAEQFVRLLLGEVQVEPVCDDGGVGQGDRLAGGVTCLLRLLGRLTQPVERRVVVPDRQGRVRRAA